ncbi:MAG: ribonuclease HI [Spirochaetales bacterium]|nr:ribonuclease HI [Spirochaetales bacterium]
MKKVLIYTDGACSGNPGPGGWGAILKYGEAEKEISGGEALTTNNRMELTAAIMALSALKESCEVDLYSDSKYLIDSFSKGWVYSWQKAGFKKKGKDVPNTDLWIKLLQLFNIHKVNLIWVKGHAENEYNNRCDKLAVSEWKRLKGNS